MKVLLVDDHTEVRRMTAAHPVERGFVVDAVGGVAAAGAGVRLESRRGIGLRLFVAL